MQTIQGVLATRGYLGGKEHPRVSKPRLTSNLLLLKSQNRGNLFLKSIFCIFTAQIIKFLGQKQSDKSGVNPNIFIVPEKTISRLSCRMYF